jgi:hypothetical protein
MGQNSQEIIRHWSPDTFASGMLNSVEVALTATKPIVGWLDQILLWIMLRR